MWSKAALVFAMLAGACATANPRISYEAKPNADGSYALQLQTRGYYEKRHKAELVKRAAATCGGGYALADSREIIQVCTDDCDQKLVTIATLICKGAA